MVRSNGKKALAMSPGRKEVGWRRWIFRCVVTTIGGSPSGGTMRRFDQGSPSSGGGRRWIPSTGLEDHHEEDACVAMTRGPPPAEGGGGGSPPEDWRITTRRMPASL